MKRRTYLLTLISLSVLVMLTACATVPIVVPQSLIEARAALGMAKKASADILVPDEYQSARKLLNHAEAAFAAEKSITTVETYAFEAKANARISEAHARRQLAEQEYDRVQQAMITQQTLLMALTQKDAALKAAHMQIQESTAQRKAAEEKALEEARKRSEAEEALRKEKEKQARLMAMAQKIKNAKVKLEERGLVINLSGKVLFDTGSSKLQKGAMSALDQVAKVLNEFPDYRVKIEGHTDSTGDLLSNNMLSQARAESVLNYLNQKGVSLDSLRALGVGPSRPVANNKTAEGRQLNRRVEIILEKIKEEKKTE